MVVRKIDKSIIKYKIMVKLNLGCGLQCPEGWVNIDSSLGVRLSKRPILKKLLYAILPTSIGLPNIDWPKNTKWMELTKPFEFQDNSVDYIYSSHTFEHLTYQETSFVLKESLRVLKLGGVIRIIVPDFEILIQNYLDARKNAPETAALKFHEYSGFFEIPYPNSFKELIKFYFKRKNNHAFLYDRQALTRQFKDAGFAEIKEMKYAESRIPNIEEIDNEDRFVGAICLEAKKI